MEHIDISRKLKELISLHNMNIKEFAEFVGISRTSLTGYLNQKVTPTIDPLVQICQKCNVSLDWLCSQSNQKHFFTVADIIINFKELQNIHSLEFDIKSTKETDAHNLLEQDKYLCSISFEGHFDNALPYGQENNCAAHLCKFIYDWKCTTEQLKNLPDKEIKENYYKMWLEKQLEHYSTIPVKTQKEKDQEEAEQAQILFDSIATQGNPFLNEFLGE